MSFFWRLAAVVLVALILSIYFLIPVSLSQSQVVIIKTSEIHAFQFLTNKTHWAKWWPGRRVADSIYNFNNGTYDIQKFTNSGATLNIKRNDYNVPSQIVFIAANKESVKITWNTVQVASPNPIARLQQYFVEKQLNRDIKNILTGLKTFLEDDRNVYGIDVKLAKVKDSVILATTQVFAKYPTTTQVYELVGKLQQQAKLKNIKVQGAPMLNVHQSGTTFETMVGMPVSSEFKASAGFLMNKMVLGNILEAEVKGGPNTVNAARIALENYRKDYGLISPAIPYQTLVTNRLSQPDTSKWITKLYYPIY
ncbi:hypothetical protein BDD43_0921 [Mucilaginibacter gracilis]|uniref:Effector-binding domain-containing protein n=1 Tax=Mucilaginibacter gracilis TaxID=423350 RepID=A0A495IVK1_9SPHI|nr:hypothetical protein [Mucilaginibacter gracilis]RKR80787.1 hypothetical protein BDD43_0921 [Mucilaginibacter gracilis]